MKILVIVFLLALTFGGIHAAFPNILGIHTFLGSGESEGHEKTVGVQPSSGQEGNLSPQAVDGSSAATGALSIINSEMYYNAPSYVTIRNSGVDDVMLQSVSYGETNIPIPNIQLNAGEQKQLTIPQTTGVEGARYILQVQGVSLSSGKYVTAQATAILMEPVSKLGISFSQIDASNAENPLLRLEVLNSGMDSVSIVSIECGAPIPRHLWGMDGTEVRLLPNESNLFDIKLDSRDCISTKRVVVRGENSVGNFLFASADVHVTSPVIQSGQDTQGATSELVGTKLPMGQAVISIQDGGHYVLSFEIVNTHYQDVQIDSLKVNGAEIPGWNGMTLLANTSTKSTITSSYGISISDIGMSVDIVILGHVFGGPQQGSAASSFYAVTSAVVYGP